jgi:hypothetical protein
MNIRLLLLGIFGPSKAPAVVSINFKAEIDLSLPSPQVVDLGLPDRAFITVAVPPVQVIDLAIW